MIASLLQNIFNKSLGPGYPPKDQRRSNMRIHSSFQGKETQWPFLNDPYAVRTN